MASAARTLPDAEESRPSPRKQLRITSRAKLIIDRVVAQPDVPVEWPSPIGYALAELTPKQRHFAVCVATGMGRAEAYRRAYDVADDTPLSTLYPDASVLSSHPKVSHSIDLVECWLDRQWLLESQEVLEYGYQRLYEEAETAPDAGDRIRAATQLLKAHGAFVSRSEVKHIHIDASSESDKLIDAIGALLGLAQAKLNDRESKPLADSKTINATATRVSDSD